MCVFVCVCVGGGGGGRGGVLDTSLCEWLDTSLFYFNLHVSLPFTCAHVQNSACV